MILIRIAQSRNRLKIYFKKYFWNSIQVLLSHWRTKVEDQNQYFCCGRQWVKPVLNQRCTSTAAFLASFFFFFWLLQQWGIGWQPPHPGGCCNNNSPRRLRALCEGQWALLSTTSCRGTWKEPARRSTPWCACSCCYTGCVGLMVLSPGVRKPPGRERAGWWEVSPGEGLSPPAKRKGREGRGEMPSWVGAVSKTDIRFFSSSSLGVGGFGYIFSDIPLGRVCGECSSTDCRRRTSRSAQSSSGSKPLKMASLSEKVLDCGKRM